MTDHKVQCIPGPNGEPYGRYCNPIELNSEMNLLDWDRFRQFAEANTFPMPGAEIGKTYERDQVEVEYQMKEDGVWYKMGYGEEMKRRMPEREWKVCFRLIPQPVEKEPEKCDICKKADVQLWQIPFAPESRICEPCWDDFIKSGKDDFTVNRVFIERE